MRSREEATQRQLEVFCIEPSSMLYSQPYFECVAVFHVSTPHSLSCQHQVINEDFYLPNSFVEFLSRTVVFFCRESRAFRRHLPQRFDRKHFSKNLDQHLDH